MLGNFSFGDYFKHDAIQYAWELLTGENWFNLPKERLWVTVYETDDEAYEIWEKKSVSRANVLFASVTTKAHRTRLTTSGRWVIPALAVHAPRSSTITATTSGVVLRSPEEDGDRYIEIWNIVFMQFNRQADGTMEPLPKPSVDTGMGRAYCGCSAAR